MPEIRRLLLRPVAAAARRLERQAPAPREARRILLCATGGLGNAILLEPLVRALRAGCPRARMDLLLTNRAAADLVRALGWADGVETMPEGDWYAGGAILRRFGGPIRARRYDFVLRTFLTAPDAVRASLVTRLSGAPVRVAFGTPRANPFETHLLADDPTAPETERHLALAAAIGVERAGGWRPAAPPAEGMAWAEGFLAEQGGAGPILGMHPGSDPRFTAKRWPAGRFGALATMAAERLGARPIVFGGPDDREAVEEVLAASGGAARAAAAQPIGATAGLVARCAAFVTNDSGLMHLAGLMGVPTLALFGPSDPIKNRPLGPGARILRLGLPCSPCSKEHAMNLCEHHDCLRTLEVDRVFDALADLLARRDLAAPRPAAGTGGTGTRADGEARRGR